MTKVAINCDWGGFSLTTDILARVIELQGLGIGTEVNGLDRTNEYYLSEYSNRTNAALCQAILEAKAKGTNGSLRVVEVPEGVEFVIEDYDGCETVEEVHRTFSKWATL